MTINPRDYDLDELRKMARERGESPGGSGGPGGPGGPGVDADGETADPDRSLERPQASPAREQFQSGLYRELLPLEAAADDVTKPYLTAMPESYAAEHVVFEWLEFLLGNFGYKGTSEALQYYESVGWITEDVAATLNDYLLGVGGPSGGEGTGDVDDHKLSLVYIARLASMC